MPSTDVLSPIEFNGELYIVLGKWLFKTGPDRSLESIRKVGPLVDYRSSGWVDGDTHQGGIKC